MIIDQAEMTDVVLRYESELAKRGWDAGPGQLSMLIVESVGGYASVAPMMIQPSDFSPHEATGLERIADDWFGGSVDEGLQKLPEDVRAALAGVIFACEAWENTVAPEMRSGKPLADLPGSVEIRMVLGVDTAGRTYFCKRVRGHGPTVEIISPDDPDRSPGGRVTHALAKLIFAMTRFAPDGAADMAALRSLIRRSRVGA